MMDVYIQRFLDYIAVERGLSDNTVVSYARDLAQFAGFLAEREVSDPRQIDEGCIVGFLNWMNGRKYASTSIARKTAALRSFVKFLCAEREIAGSPFTTIETRKLPRRLPKSLDLDELSRLLNAPNVRDDLGLRDKAMLETLYASGLRVSELIGLKMDDVDLKTGFLRCTGKGDKERVVPLGEIAAHCIAVYVDNVRGHLAGAERSEYLFLTKQVLTDVASDVLEDHQEIRCRGRNRKKHHAAHAPALVCDPSS